MPRKTDYDRSKKSRNERSMDNRERVNSPIPSFGANDVHDVMMHTTYGNLENLVNDIGSSSNYSDFVSKANERSSGWYSTIANGLPFVNNLHRAILGRDSAEDYLKNNGLSWGDMEGYNDIKLLGSASSNLSPVISQAGTYLQNIANDLGKLYSGQQGQSKIKMNGYHSNYMDSW